MITKGVSDIKGVHSLNTQPGPLAESNRYLKLYRLAVEKENLIKRLTWTRRRTDQTEKRLTEIGIVMQRVEERGKGEEGTKSHAAFRSAFIRY
jgi:hypothetical protein